MANIIEKLKENKLIAYTIIIVGVIIAIAELLDAGDNIRSRLFPTKDLCEINKMSLISSIENHERNLLELRKMENNSALIEKTCTNIDSIYIQSYRQIKCSDSLFVVSKVKQIMEQSYNDLSTYILKWDKDSENRGGAKNSDELFYQAAVFDITLAYKKICDNHSNFCNKEINKALTGIIDRYEEDNFQVK